jgi:hypothetical protein
VELRISDFGFRIAGIGRIGLTGIADGMVVLVQAADRKAQFVVCLAWWTTIYSDSGWNHGPMITTGKHFDWL